ncbi:MAG: 3'-5' exonuclease [Lachnospiraceae bacterium]|nr:3'-5' exonuclease [Lachnospiraceae bacterium]
MWRNTEKTKREIETLLVPGTKLIIFDTETTGLGKDAKIIQFSGIRYVIDTNFRFQEEKVIDIYINPEMPLPEKIKEITGLTDEILSIYPNEMSEIQRIKEFLLKGDVFAAYNSPFDMRMLEQMSERTKCLLPQRPVMDVLELVRDQFVNNTELENHKLQTITEYLFPDLNFQFHSAIQDVKATEKIMSKLIPIYLNDKSNSEEKLKAYLEWASYNENPRQKSQKRIKLKLTVGEYGDIFWDVVKKCWSCKSTTKAKKLFSTLDIANLEQQLLNKYGWRYKANDMNVLASEWGKANRIKQKQQVLN